MRIVVTGTQGQAARALVERAGAWADVTVVPVGRPQLDLTDLESIEPALVEARPDAIVSAAAYTAVDQAESEPEVARVINADAPLRIARAAERLGVPLIHLSTDYVFDGTTDRPYREDDPVAPLGVYGQTKYEGEEAVRSQTANHAILRTAWVYSPWGKNFVRMMLRLGETRDRVRVVGDQRGAPTSALDIANACLAVAQKLKAEPGNARLRGTFHMTGSGEGSWAEFADTIFHAAEEQGRPPVAVETITTAEYPTPARRPANSRLDCTKFEEAYGLRLPVWPSSARACVARILTGNEQDTTRS